MALDVQSETTATKIYLLSRDAITRSLYNNLLNDQCKQVNKWNNSFILLHSFYLAALLHFIGYRLVDAFVQVLTVLLYMLI